MSTEAGKSYREFVSIRLVSAFFCSLALYIVSAGSIGSDTIRNSPNRVEHISGSKVLMDLFERVNGLQHEIRELRGQVEVQSYALSQMKQDQQNRYLNLARRLQRVEATAGPGIGTSAGGSEISFPQQIPLVPKVTNVTQSQSPVQKTPKQPRNPPSLQSIDSASVGSYPEGSISGPNQERQAYQAAFGLLKEGAYQKAITAFEAFLKQYPRSHSQHADSARYWLGETYYVTQQYQSALEEFQKFLHEYPSSPNFADALLKVGYTQHELGQKTKAGQTLSDLIERYPNTTEAYLAKNHLREIETGKLP
uniref:Cell division coordinator CpoB n=1 Tax=Candidatus Kentrum eta TaxID=2126337 RepID=A0A450VJR2_9GAMM|nr:MAG: Beta-barrel assembly machine subunit BamD [Candidatus Kentron sp. H]VFK01535.1 MAG: Beta-barrel assembly machine subunit BamD [Candidatus Kentron sp. H]VFK05064.1 MAG: Beta-barrel assembly machine subunit BamD [Candidatus Kentron sp. H]